MDDLSPQAHATVGHIKLMVYTESSLFPFIIINAAEVASKTQSRPNNSNFNFAHNGVE